MKKLRRIMEKPWAAYTTATCSAVLLYLLLTQLTGPVAAWLRSLFRILSPVVTGLVLAYLMDPIAKWLENRPLRRLRRERLRRSLAVILAVIFVLLVVFLLLLMLTPALVDSISTIVSRSDSYAAFLQKLLTRLDPENLGFDLNLNVNTLTELATKSANTLVRKISQNMGALLAGISSFGTSILDALLGMILAVYFLLDKKRLTGGLNELRRSAVRPDRYDRRTSFWRRCHTILIQYIGCTLLDSLIIAAANALFMAIMGMPYIPLISVLAGVTNILPTFGPVIGALLGAFILVLDKPLNALWFLIFTLVLQLADGNVIKPRLFKSSLGIPAVWSLIAIILGGKLFGVVGILLAIPAAAVLRLLYAEQLLPRLKERNADAIPASPPEPPEPPVAVSAPDE